MPCVAIVCELFDLGCLGSALARGAFPQRRSSGVYDFQARHAVVCNGTRFMLSR
jgi:hypothetical protein